MHFVQKEKWPMVTYLHLRDKLVLENHSEIWVAIPENDTAESYH